MSATADPGAEPSVTVEHDTTHELTRLTIDYTVNPSGVITAQIREFPAAISQGRSHQEAWSNVLDALHDLTHEPTADERILYTIRARVIEPLTHALAALRGHRRAAC